MPARPAVITLAALWFCLYPIWCAAMDVEIRGLPEDIAERIRNSISIEDNAADETIDHDEARRRMARGRQQLKRSMTAFGFYRARVSAELAGETGGWKAIYRVTPGEPAAYEKVRIEITGPARSEESLSQYLDSEPLAPGEPVEHARYESVKQELLKRTIELGYLDASLSTHRVEVDPDSYSAEATIVVDSGPLFHFGEIRLLQDELHDDYLRRFVAVSPGDRYSDRKLLRVEEDLRNSNYFEQVRVEPLIDQADQDSRVPVEVRLTPRKRSEYQAGLGYGTDTGARGSLGWLRHRVNRLGHRFRSSLQLSEIGGSVEGRYIIPFGDPRREEYELFASYVENAPDTSDSELARIGVLRSTAMGRTRLNLSFAYQREDFTVAGQSGLTDLFIPGIGLSRVTADDRMYTRKGMRWNVSVQGSAGLLSDFAFIQPRASGKLIRSIGDLRVILRGEAAYTAAKLEKLPASLRFFAGGDQSVRGFGYETLGPENEDGEVTGGRRLLVGSAEVDYGVAENWRLAAFVDAGNAFDDFHEPLRKSVGIGVRRITPIGPIRVDLAHPFSGGDSLRLHITLGPDL
ncbi:MAG TPA: autotransporter assembly complex family protein [Arenicellales bacterium]|nr:autotransporter assembly complex family protein [Arenicellales bacterium]